MSIISSFLDLIYPPLCCLCRERLSNHNLFFLCGECAGKIEYVRKPVCSVCGLPGTRGRCGECDGKNYSFTRARASCLYSGSAAEVVKLFKYGKNLWLSKTVEKILGEGLDEKPELSSADVIVPVPLARAREKERGFNQSEILSRAAGRKLEKKVSVKNLIRFKNTPPQTSLPADERRKNISGIFRVKDRREFSGREVLLIDDVFTTGSTANECSKELLSAGARRVNVLTLARRP